MNVLKFIPVIFSFLLLSAHFSRAGLFPLVVLFFVLPILLFIKRRWVARLLQTCLVIGAIEWLRTLFVLIGERQSNGLPWFRLVIILGLIALFTGLSAFVFNSSTLKQRYRMNIISKKINKNDGLPDA